MRVDEYYMKEALKEAYLADTLEEVPIGCVIVRLGEILARGYNRKTIDNVSTYHAEILAIEEACRKLGTWYLDDCILYTTVEPCMMCTGAILQARIPKVVFGTFNDSFGYLTKAKDLKIEIKAGIMKEECSQVLTDFFKRQRIRSQDS